MTTSADNSSRALTHRAQLGSLLRCCCKGDAGPMIPMSMAGARWADEGPDAPSLVERGCRQTASNL